MNFDKSYVLTNATAITPYRRENNCTLVLKDQKIAQMGNREDIQFDPQAEELDLTGHYVMPGFIDVHVHGGMGYDFADEDPEAFDEISKFHASHGTTTLIGTLYAQPKEELFASVGRLRDYCENSGPDKIIEGIHLEGPFLNPEMHGAIRPDFMWPADVEDFKQLMDVGGKWVRVMTIAPEMPGAFDVLRSAALRERGNPQRLHLSIGHSNAHYEQIAEAIDCGLEGVTHIFNAMPSLHHRRPGVLGGTLLRDELFVEVIADAVHVHPAMLQLLLKVKKADKILLITDAIRAAGKPDGDFIFSGQPVVVRDGRAYLAKSPETLAGSTLTMDSAIKTIVKAGASLEEAAQMASLNAARILEWKYRRGILAVGKDADLVVLDQNLDVAMTIKSGQIIYIREQQTQKARAVV